MKEKSFTVTEVLLAVVVIAILAAIVIPRITKTDLYSRYLVYTTAHKVSADLRLARRLAVTTGINHRLKCDKTGESSDYNEYAIYKKNNGTWDLVGEKKSIPDEITVKGDELVTFLPSGAAQNDRTFRYEEESYKYRAVVKQQTGRVKLESYE